MKRKTTTCRAAKGFGDRAIRRGQIVDAVVALLIRGGTEHLTIKQIAGAVGVSEALIYRHFRNKREILSMLADRVEGNLMGDIEKARRQYPAARPLEELENILSHHLSGATKKQGDSFQIMAEIISLGDRALSKKAFDAVVKYESRIREVLDRGIRTGDVRGDVNAEAAAAMFFGMVQQLVSLWALSNRSFVLKARQEPLWRMYRHGIVG